jgi:hypothetical protein
MQWEQLTQEPVILAIAAAVVVVAVVAAIIWLTVRRRRRDRLQRRFGAEYQRTVDEQGSRRAAERDLDTRQRQRERMQIRPVTVSERERVRARLEEAQASFVDAPEVAVRTADQLIDETAALRGYQPVDEAGRLAAISVDHPEDTAVHRRRMMMLDGDRHVETEELRQMMLGARRLLERLLQDGEDEQPDAPGPPRSLLGLEEAEDEEAARVDDEHEEPPREPRSEVGADDRDEVATPETEGRPARSETTEAARTPTTSGDEREPAAPSATEADRTPSTQGDEREPAPETIDLTETDQPAERR